MRDSSVEPPRDRNGWLADIRRAARHPSVSVRAQALEMLGALSLWDPGLLAMVRRELREAERSGGKALAAQVARIRKRLDRRRARPAPVGV